MASASEDDFLRVLEEMNRLCGEGSSDIGHTVNNNNNEVDVEEEDLKLSKALSPTTMQEPTSSDLSVNQDDNVNDPLEDIFAPSSDSGTSSLSSGSSRTAPLIGDQLLSSVASTSTPTVSIKMGRRAASASNLNAPTSSGSPTTSGGSSRSRHCSANSAKSCVSFDSAIGDVYSIQTPTKGTSTSGGGQTGNGNSSGLSTNDNCSDFTKNLNNNHELDIFDICSSSSSSPTLATNSTSTATASAGLQFDNLAASVCFDRHSDAFLMFLFQSR